MLRYKNVNNWGCFGYFFGGFRFYKISCVNFLLFFSLLTIANAVSANNYVAFGPKTYTRSTGAPVTVVDDFSYPRPGDICLAKVYSGGLDNTYKRVASAIILFNGQDLFTPNEFNPNVGYIEHPVTMAADNELSVEVRGIPGSALSLIIECENYDNTPPEITASITPQANENGWHNSDTTVSFTCTDADSDIVQCTDPVTVTTEGANQTVTGTAEDSAGNTNSTSVSVSLDKTAPDVTVVKSPLTTYFDLNNTNWNDTDVTVSFECFDATSGVVSCPSTETVAAEGATGNTVTVSDLAGNSTSASYIVHIDKSAPTITARPIPGPNAAGWNNTDISVHFDCADAVSGVAECSSPVKVTTEGANQTVSGSVKDFVAKTAEASVTLNIDKTPPVISISSPANSIEIKADSILVTGTVTDLNPVTSLSINGQKLPLTNNQFSYQYNLAAGYNALEFVATDIADNQSSEYLTITRIINHPPAITSTAVTSAVQLVDYSYQVVATDPDEGDQLSYSLTRAPEGMKIDSSTGLITWIPGTTQLGDFDVEVSVTDLDGAQATQPYVVTVTEPAKDQFVCGNIFIGRLAIELALNGDGSQLFVVNFPPTLSSTSRGSVSVADTASRSVIDALDLHIGFPFQIATNIARSKAYVTISKYAGSTNTVGYSSIEVIDTNTHTVVKSIPTATGAGAIGIVGARTKDRIYVAARFENMVYVIDTNTDSIIAKVQVSGLPVGIDISADDQFVYAMGRDNTTVYVIDTDTNSVVKTIWLNVTPSNSQTTVAASPNGKYLFATTIDSRTIGVVDTDPHSAKYGRQIGVITTAAPGFFKIVSSLDGRLLYAVSRDKSQILVIDTNPNSANYLKVISTFVDGASPRDIVVGSSQYGLGYIANAGTRNVTVLCGGNVKDNTPPTITSTPVTSATNDIQYQYPVTVNDPDPFDELTFELIEAPAGMTVDPKSGVITWLPTVAQVGSHSVTVRVNDSYNFSDQQTFTVTVVLGNQKPYFTSTPVTTAVSGQPYSYDVDAVDPDNDPLTYSLKDSPAGMSIDSTTGLITWTPTEAQSGANNVTVLVTDGQEHTINQSFTIQSALPSCSPGDELVEPVNLTDWVVESVPGSLGGGAWRWEVDSTGLVATQYNNADTTNFLSLVDYSAQHMRGTFRTDGGDDDGMGITFGYKDQNHYYVLYWRNGRTTNQVGPLQVFRVNNGFAYPWDGLDTLYRKDIAWQAQVTYTYDFSFREGGFDITLKQGDVLIDNISIEDTTFTTGRFGFVNSSQALTSYTANTVQTPCVQTGANQLPKFVSQPVIRGFENTPYQYQAKAADPDIGDTISYSLTSAPAGMVIDSATGLISWNWPQPTSTWYRISVRAEDNKGGFTSQNYLLYIRPPNNPPVITSDYVKTAEPNALYVYDVNATDADNDPLTYDLDYAPQGMTIDSVTGVIHWTPTIDQIGFQQVSVRVNDGIDATSQQFAILVVDPSNTPPSITSTPTSTNATEKQLYTYDVNATDPDNDALTYSLTNAPAGMNIDSASGLISWTPAVGQAGSYTVAILVEDLRGGTATQNFTLNVQAAAPNVSPQFTSSPALTAKSGYQYTYQISASDSNNDALTYTLQTAPAGMTVSATGLITWTPTDSDIGTYDILVRVSDGEFYVDQGWTLTILDSVVPVSATVVVDPTSVNEGDTVTIVAKALNTAGEATVQASLDGAPLTLDANGMAQVTAQGIGPHQVVASVTDVSGTAQVTATLYVIDPTDTTAPAVGITSPATDATLTSFADISGFVNEANLDRYVLAYAPAGSGNFTVLAQGNTAFTDQVIARLDGTMMVNGLYDIVLQAWDQSGHTSSSSIQVLVDGNMKVGNFSFTVVDMEVPVSGIPIRVTRTYDSRRRNDPLDFGHGWSVGYQDVKVDESRVPGKDWALNTYPSGPLGLVPLYCVEPLGNLRVTVTLPDGRVESFKPKATPSCSQGGAILDVTMSFEPEAGTLSKLETEVGLLVHLVNGNLQDLSAAEPYNPDRYVLTTKEGFVYHINQQFGIEKVQDPNGNTLTYTKDGIIHSDGKSVLFHRDGLGRITSITDPNQNTITYDYDSAGDLTAFTDLEHNTTHYTYAPAPLSHALVDIIDPLGRGVVKNIYDDNGRLIAQEDANGIRTEFSHDIEGRESVVTNRRGYITRYFYDDRGNVTVKVDSDGATVYEYDQWDNLLSTMNPLGEMSYATYDDRRNQLTQTDDLGNSVSFEYNPRGQETKIYDARGNAPFENTYDIVGNLLEVKDPLGNTATQDFNAKGQMIKLTDALGHITSFTYDDVGNKLTETDSEGHVTRFTYDANGNVLTETRTRTVNGIPVDETTRNEYDKLNRLVQTADALGHITRVEYDIVGNEIARIDAKGNRTEFEYDAYRRLIQTVYPDDGSAEQKHYDAEGNLLAVTDRLGRITQYHYDALNRQTRVIYPDGTFTQTEYDGAGRVIAEIDARGNRTEHEYDRAGRRTISRDAALNETAFEYDKDGNLIKQTDAKGHTMSYEYDVLDRKIKTTFHDGSATRDQYDALGRVIAKIDQSGIQTQFEYDSVGRLTAVIDALGQRTRYAYDEVGNKLSQTDANLHTTHWSYDALGQVQSRTLPEGQVESFTYDANGNQETHTDFNGHLTAYDYDVNNRLITVTYHDGSGESYTYDVNGNRETASDARGSTRYTYDDRDRLKTETQPDGTVLSYDYDAAGNRTLLQTQIPNAQSGVTDITTTRYSYDNLNRLYTVTDHHNQVTTYGYDAVGNRQSVSYPNGTTTTYTYDALNRLQTVLTVDSGNIPISRFDYTLYPTGQRHTITDLAGNISTYTYDDVYRLIEESINHVSLGTVVNNYQYDPVGNRLSATENGKATSYVYDMNDRLLSSTQGGITTAYSYDDNGNTLSKTASGDQTIFAYDFRNKLVQATHQQGGLTTANTTFAYDIDGNRVQKTDNGNIVNFVVDRNQSYAQVVQELDAQNVNQVTYTHGDDLISQDRNQNLNYYNYDGLGSTRSLTDSLGQITDTYDYNAYGTLLDQNGSTENKYLYTGEQFDSSLDNYYLRARYYDPASGRFTQMDSWMGINSDPVTLHKYLYANDDPINGIDPSGHITLMDVSISGLEVSFGNVVRYTTIFNRVLTGIDTAVTIIDMGKAIRQVLANNTIMNSVKLLGKTGTEPNFTYQLSNPEEGLNTLFSHLPEIVKNVTQKGLIKNFLSNKKNDLLVFGPTPEFKTTPWPSTGLRILIGKIRLAKTTRKVFLEVGSSKKYRGRFIGVGNTQGKNTSYEQWFRMDYHGPHGNEDAVWGNYHVHYGK